MVDKRRDRVHEHPARIRLQEVAADAGLDQIAGKIVHFVNGEYKDARGGCGVPDAAGRFQPVHFRHCDIKDDDVGLEFEGPGDGFATRRGLTTDVPASVRFEQPADPASHDLVIVGDENLGHAATQTGSTPRYTPSGLTQITPATVESSSEGFQRARLRVRLA